VPYAVWIVSRSQSHHHDTPGANPENGANRRRPFAVQILTQRDEGEEFADDFIDVACCLRRTRPELFVVEPDVFAAIAVENAVDRDRQPLDVRLGGPGAIMAEVLQCHVFARPDFAMGGSHGDAPRDR
jgi:hypothetical protein